MATTTENVEEMTYKSKKHYFKNNRTKKKKKYLFKFRAISFT